MKRRYAGLLPFLLLAACADEPTAPLSPGDRPSLSRTGQAFDFTTIEPPGARYTVAQGINARGDIVGWYGDADGREYGFLLRDGVFTKIEYPGAAWTDARGISPDGVIVGSYAMPGEPGVAFHGFRMTPEGEFARVDYPGHLHTIAQRILPDGTILGCYHDNNTMGSMRGMTMGRHGNTATDAYASMHNGATPDLRKIVGLYTNQEAMRTEGYVIEDGVFRPLLVPGSTLTTAWDINPRGDIVGIYRDGSGFHGFLLNSRGYTSIDVPGAAHTRAFGINAGGQIVGMYVAAGRIYGFRATPMNRAN